VIAATGAVEHDQVAEAIERHFAAPRGEPLGLSEAPPPYARTVHHQVRADLQQLHLALGTRGVAYPDADRYAIVVLSTLLGGGMSSRLFQSVREEAGLAYAVFSIADFHRDAGMLSIQLACRPSAGARRSTGCARRSRRCARRARPKPRSSRRARSSRAAS